MRTVSVWRTVGLVFLMGAAMAWGQATTSVLTGTVTDSSKATVPGAAVTVVNPSTGQKLNAQSDARGNWTIPDMSAGVYQVTVSHSGFKTQQVSNVKIDIGVPATVNVTLQVGAQTQTVEVTGGAEVVQTDTATVASTIQGAQIHELPFTSRNTTELIATQAGTQTGDAVRQSLIDGLPQAAINQTLDGINIQDNSAKSTDGVFVAIFPRTDAVEEVTMSTAAAGADSLGQGAVQIKFVTRSGTNQWHGDLFEQNRNQALEANYFFNAAAGLPRDKLNLNEFGGRIGGPILKNKLFFFFAMEAFRLPQGFLITNQNWLTPTAQTGIFTYKDSNGAVQTVNLYNLAAAEDPKLPAGTRAFPTAPDPLLAKTEASIQNLVNASGIAQVSRVASNNDYNRYNFSSSPTAVNNRNFPTSRIDYDINPKNRLSFIANYQTNARTPDALNGTVAILPGTGTVLGSSELASQLGIEFSEVLSLRTTVSSSLTNDVRFGVEGGNVWFSSGLSPAPYPQWGGVLPSFGGYITNPYRSSIQGQSKRNSPVTTFSDSVSWLKGNHLFNYGFDFSSDSTYTSGNGTQTIPTVTLGNISTDPDNSGATNLFTSTTLPNSTSSQRADAASLYAVLTGRVSSITSSASLDPTTNTYGAFHTVADNRQREFGLYIQDSWRLTPRLTLNYGVRYDKQQPFQNITGTYTSPGLAGLYGVSGIGNLFMPGTLTGVTPVFNAVPANSYAYAHDYKFDPTIGFAYQVPEISFLHALLGTNAVVRGGYAISNIREGIGEFTGVLGRNPGATLSTSVSPTTTPTVFAPGNVEFSDPGNGIPFPTLAPTSLDPKYPAPSYPIAVQTSNSLFDYDPNLKMEYVESWNFGLQRQLGANTAIEFRYVGNHGVDLYRTVDLNEVNIFQPGTNDFFNEFQGALNNLNIARQTTPTSNNFGNQGLPGQVNTPILATALGTTNNQTTANQLVEGAAGTAAASIAHNTGEMAKLVAAGYPVNLFEVNPATTGSASLTNNSGGSTYNSLQIEVRHRLSRGLQIQGSYVYAKSLTNTDKGVMSLRDPDQDKGPSFSDERHAFKLNWIYDLPIGTNHAFLNSSSGLGKLVTNGWSFAGVARVQSGVPEELGSGTGFATFNNDDPGVVLHNITPKQLQADMHTYIVGSDPSAVVYYLPQALIANSLIAYNVNPGTIPAGAQYIGPPAAGQLGQRIYLYGPWLSKWDMSMVKLTPIHESMNLELRLQALNVFNTVNFLLPTQGLLSVAGSSFGQTTSSFRDFSNTNDPGSRTLEFVITLNF